MMPRVEELIDALVAEVAERYPPERIALIKRRSESIWNGHGGPTDGRTPFMVSGMAAKSPPEIPGDATEDQGELLRQLQVLVEHADWQDELLPGLAPGVRQVLIPSFFGCTEEVLPDSARVSPVIRDPQDVHRLPSVGFGPGTVGGKMLERMRLFRAAVRGVIPVFEADMQGPFSVASQIWGIEGFLAALYESPREVHALIGRATEAIITFVRLMQEAAGDELVLYHCPPAIWFPPERGIAVSEDLLAVVSPAVVREFIRPYAERIAEAFGGVLLHSCGYINHTIEELNAVKGLVGLNFASSETDLLDAAKRCRESVTLVTHSSPVSCRDLRVLDAFGHAEICGQASGTHRRLMCALLWGTAELDAGRDGPRIAAALEAGGRQR